MRNISSAGEPARVYMRQVHIQQNIYTCMILVYDDRKIGLMHVYVNIGYTTPTRRFSGYRLRVRSTSSVSLNRRVGVV